MNIKKISTFFIKLIGKINFKWILIKIYGKYYCLTKEDHAAILEVLSQGNYIILTRRLAHASTYACNVGHLLVTGRLGYYSHACFNIDMNNNLTTDSVRILEAESPGVELSKFEDVFDCDSVCILRPVMPDGINWEQLVEDGLKKIGKQYDFCFDINDSSADSCVEVILELIKDIPDYEKKFHGLMAMINIEHNLTPDMFIESGSFEKVLEIRRHF